MADIFVSYSQHDSQRATQVVNALVDMSWDVWWDPTLIPGPRFRTIIEQQLRSARCVVVLWSQHAIESDFVIDEAEDGRRRGVLVQALIENIQPPLGFRELQWANLADWSGDIDAPEFRAFRSGISRHLSAATHPVASGARPQSVEHLTGESDRIDQDFTQLFTRVAFLFSFGLLVGALWAARVEPLLFLGAMATGILGWMLVGPRPSWYQAKLRKWRSK